MSAKARQLLAQVRRLDRWQLDFRQRFGSRTGNEAAKLARKRFDAAHNELPSKHTKPANAGHGVPGLARERGELTQCFCLFVLAAVDLRVLKRNDNGGI